MLGISVTGNMCAGATAACIVCLGGDVLITLARAQLRVMKCMAVSCLYLKHPNLLKLKPLLSLDWYAVEAGQ